jgi:ubiquitin carboxyl-terminal hydrolase 4/11/15
MPREKETGSAQASSAASSSEPTKDASSQLKEAPPKAAGSREDPPDDPLEERRIIKALVQDADKNSKIGDLWFLVVLKWWKAWKLYSDYEERDDDHNAQPPGEIDNSPLLETGADERLRMGQLEGVDYHLLPGAAWKKLHAWYGGGPAIRRKMIGVPVAIGGKLDLKLEVEVYLTTIRLYRGDAPPGTQSPGNGRVTLSR